MRTILGRTGMLLLTVALVQTARADLSHYSYYQPNTGASQSGSRIQTLSDPTSFSFSNITHNGNLDLSGQLSMLVSATANPNQVLFEFTDNVGIASSIAQVYFDDGTLLGIASVAGSAGVSFHQLASPPDLPGGNGLSPTFQTSAGFSVGANPPVAPDGVNAASEYLDIVFNLQSGKTVDDVLAALADGSLRVGLHVQAIGPTGGSDSYVNRDGVVPAPAAVSLGLIGLGLVHLLRRNVS